ncbi:MAG: DUF1634 domain-containing protein [Thermomicrobiales bacterium]|nr:DUF1634 domain-containing protein [Thermomicrobiales bacterium]
MSDQAIIEQETAELMRRTERLTPLFDLSRTIFVWGFRIGAVLLVLGLVIAIARGEPIGHVADPLVDVPAAVLAGQASGIIDLAILWFMATPVVTVVAVATGFFRLGDRRYGYLSLIVLLILGASIALSGLR